MTESIFRKKIQLLFFEVSPQYLNALVSSRNPLLEAPKKGISAEHIEEPLHSHHYAAITVEFLTMKHFFEPKKKPKITRHQVRAICRIFHAGGDFGFDEKFVLTGRCMWLRIIVIENPISYNVVSFTRNVRFQLFKCFDIMIGVYGDIIRNSVLIYTYITSLWLENINVTLVPDFACRTFFGG